MEDEYGIDGKLIFILVNLSVQELLTNLIEHFIVNHLFFDSI